MRLSKRRPDASSDDEQFKKPSTTFEKALDAFLTAHKAENHSRYTILNYRSAVSRFLRYMSDEHKHETVDQITESDVLSWLADLRTVVSSRGKPYSSRSIQSYCRDVIAFFRWLVQHGHLDANPIIQLKEPKVDKPLIRVFTEEELRLLDAACARAPSGHSLTPDERKALAARDRAILWLLLSTGIRASELCGLLFSDIDWDSGLIYVRGKGSKERRVPFGKVARQHLRTYIQYWRGIPATDGEERIFLNVFGKPIRPHVVTSVFKRLKKVAGITDKRVSAHTCRHWFAVNCIKRGMPSTVLQGLLGHEKLEMINTYVRLAEQDNRMLYMQYSPVDALEMHHSTKGKREESREWRNARKRGKKGKNN